MNATQADPTERAEKLAKEFASAFRSDRTYLEDNISVLAEMAASNDEGESLAASRAIFLSFVERLADSFDASSVTLYNRAFAQILQHCRSLDPKVDESLDHFGLKTAKDLFDRAQRLRAFTRFDAIERTERFIVLSRVTLGADVAITSVITARLRDEFPSAEIVLVGPRKLRELFGGDSRIEFREVGYSRAGTLLDRVRSWLHVLECVQGASEGIERCVVVDPDTRLTQLALLPVCPDQQYLFFPSREYGAESTEPLSRLASSWLDEVLGSKRSNYPQVTLKESDRMITGSFVSRLRGGVERPVACINFGFGENPAKRLGKDFERELILRLLNRGAAIILDRGAGEDEDLRVESLITEVRRLVSYNVVEADEARVTELTDAGSSFKAELVAWRGRIGLLAGLIGASDVYIGYDSAGQHIAAALGVPCVDVFAGYSSHRMLDRWRPTGPAEVVVIDAAGPLMAREMADKVAQHAMRLRLFADAP